MPSVPAPLDRTAASTGAVAIQLRGLRKRFRKFTTRGQYTTLKTSLIGQLFGRETSKPRWVQVLDGIDLDVPRGHAVGVIGRNGSGKSTMLKLVAGILKPDAGTVRVEGRISPLIELGAGFHPEFSGRENIYLNGIVLGMSRTQIDERYDAIVDFAELRDSIDDPVRTYSSGMYMRLGFSIAVHAEPDILLVDEILAVGDQSFSKKCEQWLADFLGLGKTILLVSHSLGQVQRWGREVVWLDQGQIRSRGAPREVIQEYVESTGPETAPTRVRVAPADVALEGAAKLEAIRLASVSGGGRGRFRFGDPVPVDIHYVVAREIPGLAIEIAIRRADGLSCYQTTTAAAGIAAPSGVGSQRVRCRFRRMTLLDAAYTVDVAILAADGSTIDHRIGGAAFSIESHLADTGVSRLGHDWVILGADGEA